MRQQFNMFAGIIAVVVCFIFPVAFIGFMLYIVYQAIMHPIRKHNREKRINELVKQKIINNLRYEIEHTNSSELKEKWRTEIRLIESGEV